MSADAMGADKREEAAPSYGVFHRKESGSDADRITEEVALLGYAVVESKYSQAKVKEIRIVFDEVHTRFLDLHGAEFLKGIDEHNGIRLPLALHDCFRDLAANPEILEIVRKLIRNKFILNQQNGVINPPGESYNQAAWHRDLPYQHFVSSTPLAISALYCVDEFSGANGGTLVLPASHRQPELPSDAFIAQGARQIVAPAGAFIIMDAMLFHRGGENRSSEKRRAVNHLYTTAFIKQQIDIRSSLGNPADYPPDLAELFGFRYQVPRNVAEYLKSRSKK